MKTYKIVKKEDKPTIPISKVHFDEGFIIVLSNDEAVGIIVQDDDEGVYSFIATFKILLKQVLCRLIMMTL